MFKHGANLASDKPQSYCSGGRKRRLLLRGAIELKDGSVQLPAKLSPLPPTPKHYIPETMPPEEVPNSHFEPPRDGRPKFPDTVFPDIARLCDVCGSLLTETGCFTCLPVRAESCPA